MKKAIIITPDNGTYFAQAPDDLTTGDWIRSFTGNWFDCVRGDDIIGYVDDEGLMNGSKVNLVASIVFGRYLCGTVVVFGCLNADGEYDGENHDVPEYGISRIAWVLDAKKFHESNEVSI